MNRRATLSDIAKIAKVNISTVSRALNNSSDISLQTKMKIKDIAKQIGYVPDFTAKALAGKGTKSIGVIVPEISSNYYATMLDCIENELDEKDYSLIVGMAHHDYQKEIHYLNVFNNRRVDGIILAGSMYSEINKTLDKIRKRNNIPIVLVHSFISYGDYDYIFVDDIYGVNTAIEYLKELGHRNIGYIADELASRFRIEKIKNSIFKNGLILNKEHIKIGKVGFEAGGYQLMQELLNEKEIPTAVLASYDYIAIGAMKALYERGLSVPDDISIIGYDNIRESEYLPCPLTTISPPIERMVKLGANILHNKIVDKTFNDIQHVSLKPELIVRNSTAPIK